MQSKTRRIGTAPNKRLHPTAAGADAERPRVNRSR
jgi:hypothetical protein